MIPNDNKATAAAWATMETRKEVGRWLSSGRSENKVIVREDIMFGLIPSLAQSGGLLQGFMTLQALITQPNMEKASRTLPKSILTSF